MQKFAMQRATSPAAWFAFNLTTLIHPSGTLTRSRPLARPLRAFDSQIPLAVSQTAQVSRFGLRSEATALQACG